MSDLIDRQDVLRKMESVMDMQELYLPIHFKEWVIDEVPTVEERKTEWIPVKTRPMDEEERKEWSEKVGYELEGDDAVIYTSNLPDDGQECIVCTKWGNVFIDTFQNDPDYGCAFEEHGDMDGITAWMPLPKPWKGEKDE